MNILDNLTDTYSRRARLFPALLVVLPLSVLSVLSIPVTPSWWSRTAALLIASGMPFAILQFTRDRGRRIEPLLYERWGGKPTTAMLRWPAYKSDVTVRRRHALIADHLNIDLPDSAQEGANPEEADESYEIAVTALRERTRSSSEFPLVLEELTAYGYRRNTYGCQPIGLMCCVIAALLAIILPMLGLVEFDWKQQLTFISLDGSWAIVWWRAFRDEWVRVAAERYAHQLFASLESPNIQPK